MPQTSLTTMQRTLGRVAAWGVAVVLVVYAITLVLGLLALKSPQDPISDPYFTLMEILIVLLVPLLVLSMVIVHEYASPDAKAYSLAALAFMIAAMTITACVHFVVLTVSRPIAAAGLPGTPLFLSFAWPSVIYTLDILAWDFFFALSMLCAAPVFKAGRLETTVRYLLIASGVLSLAGLIGVALADMNVRNIGIVGYVGVAIVAFLLLGIVFGPGRQVRGETL